jgi:hypothetical protein
MRLVLSTAIAVVLIPVGVQAQTTVAGATPGSFRVTESGAAEYRIPIRVPPGIGGMEPRLALVYNSQTGNGLLGVGWNLEGLSAITRCPRTMAQDGVRGGINYDTDDRYCLDGQRLMAISGAYGADGTEYRTERESFTKVISYGTAGNGPAWFKAWTKSGQILEYGNTADSRIEAQGKSTVRVWAVNKVADTKGNFYSVSYTEDSLNGDYAASHLDYAGASVQLTYASRPDPVVGYQAGSLVKSTLRLTNVQAYRSSLIADYQLEYAATTAPHVSRLTSIKTCDGPGACFPATTLQWTSGFAGGFTLAYRQLNYPNDGQVWRAGDGHANHLADVNGDGKPDLVQIAKPSYSAQVMLSNGDGSFTLAHRQSNYPNDGQIWRDGDGHTSYVADVNGDGKADLVQIGNSVYGAQTLLSNGDGTFTLAYRQSNYPNDGQIWRVGDGHTTYVADVNGDGRSDLVQIGNTAYGAQVLLSNGDGTFTLAYRQSNYPTDGQIWRAGDGHASHVADVNGDGKADLVQISNPGYSAQVLLSNGDGTFALAYRQSNYPNDGQIWREGDGHTSYMADVNGDGKADLVQIGKSAYGAQVLLSKGDGTFTLAYRQSNYPTDGQIWRVGDGHTTHVADVNGDGKVDLVQIGNSVYTAQVMLSNGDGTFTLAYRQTNYPGDGQIWRDGDGHTTYVGDLDGDGKPDLLQIGNSVYSAQVVLPNGGEGNLLDSISNGLGQGWSLGYAPLTHSSVYTKDAGTHAAAYPHMDVQMPMHVVSTVTTDSGSGGTRTVSHSYGGLKAAHDGRGMLGFRWMESIDQATGLKTRAEFRQDWPYVGLPSLSKRTQSSGAVLSEASSTYTCTNPATGTACTVAAGSRYFPALAQSVETGSDLSGAALPAVTSSTQYDGFGNATQVTVSTGDGHAKSTGNVFVNDVPNWLLGRLKSSTVQSTVP